ncbi:GDP-mannose 4,6-dehydratase [Pinirhizobacter soli]|uniref:GDP-mannose 4,6-dehydratase n=1 Tax=Pinirhizobacter soli TaxID=2786953 RepID=UPI002029C55F|nr:GDP-mannose 4,6-dehydratase [Pinirhizobacter soli]
MIEQASKTFQRIYVTGATGFVGKHIRAQIAGGVFGAAQFVPASAEMDIRDPAQLRADIEVAQPDAVIHLAARSFVPDSFDDPRATFDVNLLGTLNLLQALSARHFSGRVLYVSSGDVYGMVPEAELPVLESRATMPRSPYAVSKVSAELLCRQWQLTEKLDVVVARPFNHIGPGQGLQFVVPAMASQVAAMATSGDIGEIITGDIDVTRDFSDVRDVVAAYAAILARGCSGEIYNVASGHEVRIRDILQILCELTGVKPRVSTDPSRLRATEQRRMVASAAKLNGDTGWTPAIPLDVSLKQILETFEPKGAQ